MYPNRNHPDNRDRLLDLRTEIAHLQNILALFICEMPDCPRALVPICRAVTYLEGASDALAQVRTILAED